MRRRGGRCTTTRGAVADGAMPDLSSTHGTVDPAWPCHGSSEAESKNDTPRHMPSAQATGLRVRDPQITDLWWWWFRGLEGLKRLELYMYTRTRTLRDGNDKRSPVEDLR